MTIWRYHYRDGVDPEENRGVARQARAVPLFSNRSGPREIERVDPPFLPERECQKS